MDLAVVRDALDAVAPVTCEEEGLVGCAQHHWAIVAGSANGPHHLLAEPEVGVEAVEVPLYLGEGAWVDTTESGWKSLGESKAPEVQLKETERPGRVGLR